MIALHPAFVGLADWLVTFALHSTLALATALALVAVLGRRAPALQEAVLRWSLWVALPSSIVQVAVLQSPWSTDFVLPGTAAADPSAEVHELLAELELDSLASTLAAPAFWSQWSWQLLVCLVAVAAALAGLGWLVVVHRRLRGLLAPRRPEVDARVLSTAAAVAGALGLPHSPHVSRSDRIATPIAFGFVRPEICLPERVGELGDASLRAMLAHEVAHLRGNDPAWMWGAAWLQALFPWQLLMMAVRSRWARLVELRCDAIAAREATPTAVARCLLDVAGWLQPRPDAPMVALGMAARPSALRERVEAALRGPAFRPAPRAVSTSLGGMFLSLLSVTAPGVTTAGEVDAPATALAADTPDVPDRAPRAPLAAPAAPAATPVPAPAPASAPPSPELVTMRAVSARVREEHRALLAEAETLRRELNDQPRTGRLGELHSALQRRLNDLSRMRMRLDALLVRLEPRNR